LERSANLNGQPQFLPMAASLIGASGVTTYTDTNALNSGFRFYRIGVE
jgi:hypothetical protein